jgi:hypothetical protein
MENQVKVILEVVKIIFKVMLIHLEFKRITFKIISIIKEINRIIISNRINFNKFRIRRIRKVTIVQVKEV